MRMVIAVDGDLLVPEDVSRGIQGQREAIADMVDRLGPLVKRGHELVIMHGNEPQVGYMLLRAEVASHAVHTLPLDICGADTQGATGYLLQQSLHNWMHKQGIEKDVITLVTQVVVDASDPAFSTPSKGIGPFFDRERAQVYENTRGWKFVLIPGRGYRRAVPSPLPIRIIEARTIRYLLDGGTVVICAGGGGIPVRVEAQGNLVGVEAVVDKAYTASLLAHEIEADTIVFVSSWERIEGALHRRGWENGVPVRLSLHTLNMLIEQWPEMEEAVRNMLVASQQFLRRGGRSVLIVPPERIKPDVELSSGVYLSVQHSEFQTEAQVKVQ
jgi:carbamate kinase